MRNKLVTALMQLPGIGRKTVLRKLSVTPGMACTAEAVSSVLAAARAFHRGIPAFSENEIANALERADRVEEACARLGIRTVTYLDEDYPVLLRQCADPPALLYYLGDISFLDTMNTVAVIGTRVPSPFGLRKAEELGRTFAKQGFADVSGLATGCDTGGHRGALLEGGKTVAVLPCGIDRIYPPVNAGLAREIADGGGALLSEYPPGTEAYQAAFVERDRLQAALSDGLLVVETGMSGGTHFTVRYAEEYGRIVGCVRHPEAYASIPEAAGNRMFIAEGRAVPVADAADLTAFCERLRKKRTELLRQAEGQKEAAGTGTYRQLTIEDFLWEQDQ